jgi:hypothetical protein
MLKEIIVLLYSSTAWLETMKPIPPISAARLVVVVVVRWGNTERKNSLNRAEILTYL